LAHLGQITLGPHEKPSREGSIKEEYPMATKKKSAKKAAKKKKK
jgi:hypothetical protein